MFKSIYSYLQHSRSTYSGLHHARQIKSYPYLNRSYLHPTYFDKDMLIRKSIAAMCYKYIRIALDETSNTICDHKDTVVI